MSFRRRRIPGDCYSDRLENDFIWFGFARVEQSKFDTYYLLSLFSTFLSASVGQETQSRNQIGDLVDSRLLLKKTLI